MESLAKLFDLSGRVAVVTGAGGGLGRVFAEALAAAGASVAVADMNAKGAEETVQAINGNGGQAIAVEVDVRDVASVGKLFDRANALGDVSILVNNAGITTLPARTHELKIEDWDRLMAVNLRGVFLCSRMALSGMVARRRGAIVNIASILGPRGFYPGYAASPVSYSVSKEGVIGFTKHMAAEYAGDGIRVNAICPGWHSGTDLARERRATISAEERQSFEALIAGRAPLGRRGKPEEMAPLLVYLCSDASSYVTGQAVFHDGGWTAV